jgi:LuxR family transcriptional regulator, maltose regulon positive regulatory protein
LEAFQYKLVLVSGPAGYGKTTLVIEAPQDFEKPAGWVWLDTDDNIPARFWMYLITAKVELRLKIKEYYTSQGK